MKWTSVVLLTVIAVACGRDGPRGQAATDSAFAAVQERGAEVMGVDQYVAKHRFDVLEDGGRVVLEWDSDDAAEIARIRAHMQSIAQAFGQGDFTKPFAVHDMEVPGTAVLRARKGAVKYTYAELPRGGEVRMTTSDPEIISAIRAFMEFQRSDHRAGGHGHTSAGAPWPPVATFSILAYDPATGETGGAVQSRVFSVGNGVLWAEAGAGAVATQAIVDVSYGPQALAMLRQGLAAEDVVKRVWEADPDPRPDNWSKQGRQFAVVDAKGNVAAFTGPRATAWAGHKSCTKSGTHCTAQGNILAGESVVSEMVRAFEETSGHISLRLMAALEAGQAAGGDRRGMQSAAMLIVKEKGGVWLNNDVVLRLQVDDSPQPIVELRRLVEMGARQRPRRGGGG